ncbi:MAG: TetR/AcrR family transcriptional regulator [Cyclobacteriaceae bacterium]
MDVTSLEIINSASVLFDRYGARKTTMEDIAREVGKGKSTLYYYFKNKEEVFSSVLQYEFDSLAKEINQAGNKEPDALHTMVCFIKELFSRIHRYKNLKSCLLGEVDGKSKVTASRIKEQFTEWKATAIRNILINGIDEGTFRKMTASEVEINCQAISIALTGLKFILLHEEDRKVTDQKIDNLLSLLFHGISN